jgi:DNA-3-methyladenine glycosylase
MNAAAGATADTQRAPPAPIHRPAVPDPMPRSWFERDPVALAMALLGKFVVREHAGEFRIGRIVETEAYAGMDDRASHARAGRTKRTEPMFGPAGHAYVYLVYGMHHCLNVVAETNDHPSAVLIRALEPVAGVAAIRAARRVTGTPEDRLLAGPALLCAGLSIDRTLDGHDLTGGRSLWIAPDPAMTDQGAHGPSTDRSPAIVAGPRIGVAYAGPGWADRPWRFGLASNTSISRPFPTPAGATRPTV